MSRYSKEAVQREIDRDPRISKREARAIHALLKGPTPMPRSWKPEVTADSTGKWYANGLAFATKAEAEGERPRSSLALARSARVARRRKRSRA